MTSLAALTKEVGKFFSKTNPDMVFDRNRKIEWEDSGSLVFNIVASGTPNCGFPKGRITEIFGMEHSGKTSQVLAALAEIQKRKGVGVFVDVETAFDPVYSQRTFGLVVDNETFVVFQPDNIEEVDALCDKLASLDRLDFLAFDSVDAMKPKAQIEGSLSDERRVGAHAQAMSRFVAKMRKFAKNRKIPVVFINQMRTNITTGRAVDQNVGTGAGFNPMEQYTTTGGMALRYYASLRMKLEYGGRVEDEMGTDNVSGEQAKIRSGNKIKVINIKNKVSTPFLKGLATFMFPTPSLIGGWDNAQDLLELLKKRGRVVQQSTRFTYKGLEKEFSNVGGKKASEAMFLTDSALIADATKLLHQLLQPASPTDTPVSLLLEPVTAADYSSEEFAGQDDPSSAMVGGSISLTDIVSPDEPDDEVSPVDVVSLD